MCRTGCFNGARSERAVSFVSARSPGHVGLQADVGAAAGGGARRGRFEPLLLLFHSLLQHVDLPREQVERGRYRQLAGDRQKKFVPMVCGDAQVEKIKTSSSTQSPIFKFDVTDLTDGVDEALPQLPGLCTRHLRGESEYGGKNRVKTEEFHLGGKRKEGLF